MTDRKHTPAYSDYRQDIYRFPNSFGAFVTWISGNREWELAVIQFTTTGLDSLRFVYGTEVSPYDAVVRLGGSRYNNYIEGLLDQIASWPADLPISGPGDHVWVVTDEEDE